MYTISDDLKLKVSNLNHLLVEKYKNMLETESKDLKTFIEKDIGHINKVTPLSITNLEKIRKKGGIVGVDGSNNKKGGAYPHYVELYQGLAKSTIYKDQVIKEEDIFTPLLEENIDKSILENIEEDLTQKEAIRKYKLANVELEAAIKSVSQFKPYIILMDGSLVRYKILAKDNWERLRQKCEEENVILVGVIEDIKTTIIGNYKDKNTDSKNYSHFYDREFLFGRLDYGEYIRIRKDRTEKTKSDLESVFIRTSNEPSVIGLDILDTQSGHLEEICQLILAMTPKNSRGIPLWLDIVDSEVRISNPLLEELLGSYLDREILEMFFVPERDKRSF